MPNQSPVSDAAVVAPTPVSHQRLYWLEMALTEGLGPTRIRKMIEQFGTAERAFQASLTELEAAGMRAVSAQSLAPGKSLELSQTDVQVALSSLQDESPEPEPASLFPDEVSSPHEKTILKSLKANESTHIDE
jgi:hypothetical protein